MFNGQMLNPFRRSRVGGNPCGRGSAKALWIPAYAGTTEFEGFCFVSGLTSKNRHRTLTGRRVFTHKLYPQADPSFSPPFRARLLRHAQAGAATPWLLKRSFVRIKLTQSFYRINEYILPK
jgi:hypothetical protein